VYTDNASPVPNIPSKSCGLADENKKNFDGMERIRNKCIIWLYNILDFSVPDEGYSRNVLCILNLISTFKEHFKDKSHRILK